MILEWTTTPEGLPALVATRHEYDAVSPAASLRIDALPSERHPDREAMAGYLAFGRWASGDLVMPWPLSPVVAEAIEDDASPIRLRLRDVAYAPRSVPQGCRRINLCLEPTSAPLDDDTLVVVPSTRAAGESITGSTLVIPSNAFILDAGSVGSIRARLAVAVLFAADVDADVLVLCGTGLAPREESRLAALLHSVNLELCVGNG